MKSGKDEGKQMEPPLFPRIRLTSAEKGGPKAPPRNKMALSQQLSLSASSSTSLSLSTSSMVPSTSPSHDSSSYRRSIFSTYHSLPSSMYMSARQNDSHSPGGINLNASLATFVRPEITNDPILRHRSSDSRWLTNYPILRARKRSAFAMEGPSYVECHQNITRSDRKEDQECGSTLAGGDEKKKKKNGDFKKNKSKEISPDDVVKLIGQKRFQKARRILEHQQRVFALQVFELHRLIKVQKLLAASPDLLVEDNFCSSKPKTTEPMTSLVVTKPDIDPIIPRKPAAAAAKRLSAVQSTEKSICSKPIPLIYPPLTPIPTDPSSWCLNPPPGNQWLVPVRSPSEGLVYKPYSGPYPPSGGLLAPIIGPPIFGVPESSGIGPMGPTYISPYVVPMIKPSSHISTVQLVKAPSNSTSSYNIPYKTSSRKGGCAPLLLGSSSGCSSSTKRAHVGDELPLFPTEPTLEVLGNKSSGDEGVKVIKVVPHNPKLALESAARIFRSIQEERNQSSGCRID